MDNIKNDKYYIMKIVEHIDVIINYTEKLAYQEFVTNIIIIDATMFRLVQMVEQINHLSKEYKTAHSSIKWGQIIGFRNGIVHDYGKTDYSIVYEIISEDIYDLKTALVNSLSE